MANMNSAGGISDKGSPFRAVRVPSSPNGREVTAP